MIEPRSPGRITRRTLLTSAGGAALALYLPACSGPSTSSAGPNGERVTLPTFTAYDGVKPDLPALPNGTSPYFAKIPNTPERFLTEKPSAGGAIRGFTIINGAPVPVERNPFWQGINDLLGSKLEITGVPAGGYADKFQTLVAGGELPDFCCVMPTLTPQLAGMLQARFTDLTEHLSGDAVKTYPSLANIPTYNWSGSVHNNRIYLIPSPRFALYRQYLVRADLAAAAGIDPQVRDGDALGEMLAAFTHRRQNRFATVSALGLLDMVNEMMGTPNNWSESAGKFTKDYESEQFAAALDFVAQAWKKGQIHPDAFTPNLSSNATSLYAADQSPLFPNVPSWSGNAIAALKTNPQARTQAIQLPDWDGSATPVKRWLGPGTPYYIGIPKTSPDRVKEILRVVNALASPFGTQEYMTIRYGAKDTDYTVTPEGQVTPTPQGTTNRVGSVIYLGAPALVHFTTDAGVAKLEYESEKQGMEHVAPQPNLGFVSETNLRQGLALTKTMNDAIAGVIQGRNNFDDWKSAVTNWRSQGGDTIRSEYEKAFAEAKADE